MRLYVIQHPRHYKDVTVPRIGLASQLAAMAGVPARGHGILIAGRSSMLLADMMPVALIKRGQKVMDFVDSAMLRRPHNVLV